MIKKSDKMAEVIAYLRAQKIIQSHYIINHHIQSKPVKQPNKNTNMLNIKSIICLNIKSIICQTLFYTKKLSDYSTYD